MSADQINTLRDWCALGFTIAFWVWFSAFVLTALQLGGSAIRHRGAFSTAEVERLVE